MPRAYSLSAGALHFEGALEIVQDRQDGPDGFGVGVFEHIGAFAFGAAAEIIEFGLTAQQAVQQVVLLLDQVVALGGDGLKGTVGAGGSATPVARFPGWSLSLVLSGS